MTIRPMVFLVGVILVLCVIPAAATCSGSGTSWSCPAGATASDIQNAINGASDGATITLAAGSYNWSTWIQFSTSKGATLKCATPPLTNGAATTNACTVNATGTVLGINGFSGTLTKLYRISGFQFNGNSGYGIIWFDTCNPGCRGQISQLRIDHNTFTINASSTVSAVFFGDTQSYGYYYGVIDHNTLNSSQPQPIYFWLALQDPTPPASPLGTANNLFIEDNIINDSHLAGHESTPCLSDSWGSTASVVRHNTVYNCLVPVHGIDHSGGPQNWEVYDNAFIYNSGASGNLYPDGYRMVHHQGSGEAIYFNNRFTPMTEPHNPEMLSINANYVDSVCSGTPYPCSHQAGRDFAGNLRPIYIWNNVDMVNGSIVNGLNAASTTFVAPNRDFYNAVSTRANTSPTSPFDGTLGMGFGTLANRPATCAHSNSTFPTRSQDAGRGGVGYFATDQGPQGTLYTCSATNTWTAYYTPYTYPHPLVSGGAGGGGTPVNPPTGLGATVQ
jgi:hypothetical protein